jgi:hypothetical protein
MYSARSETEEEEALGLETGAIKVCTPRRGVILL